MNNTTNKPVYGILKAAKSVPLLNESQRKMLDEHSHQPIHPQVNYYDDTDISYALSSTPSSTTIPSSPPLPTNIIYRKKRRQASSPPTTTPLPPTAWKLSPTSLNNVEQRQKRRIKSLQSDKDCIISWWIVYYIYLLYPSHTSSLFLFIIFPSTLHHSQPSPLFYLQWFLSSIYL
jgi:hypothetical protein